MLLLPGGGLKEASPRLNLMKNEGGLGYEKGQYCHHEICIFSVELCTALVSTMLLPDHGLKEAGP